jgi:integrase
MATLYKRNLIYWIAYKENGVRVQMSTKLTDHAQARRLLKHYQAVEAASYLNPRRASIITLFQWRERYLSLREKTVCRGTYRKDRQALNNLLSVLDGTLFLENITAGHIGEWYAGDVAQGTRATANSHFRTVKASFSMAAREGLIQKNPCLGVKPLKDNKPYKPYMTLEQARKLLAHLDASAPAWAELTRAALYTGARAGELCRLMASEIDLDRGYIIIQSSNGNPTKTRAARLVPIPQAARDFFATLVRRQSNPLLQNPSGDPWRVDWISHHYPRLLQGVDLDFTFHDLRRAYGAWLVAQGVDVVTVKDNMGHSSINVTVEHYVQQMRMEHRQGQTSMPGL